MSYLLTTVRADGRPHQTTIAGIWLDEGFHFVTGRGEQKARNLAAGNRNVIVSAGGTGWDGLDVVLEGEAVEVTDADRFDHLVDAYRTNTTTCSDSASSTAIHGSRQHGPGHRLRGSCSQGLRLRQGRTVQPDAVALLTRLAIYFCADGRSG